MKKWLAAFLLVVVTAALAACGGGDDKSGSSTVEKVKEAKTLVAAGMIKKIHKQHLKK